MTKRYRITDIPAPRTIRSTIRIMLVEREGFFFTRFSTGRAAHSPLATRRGQ
jgi:hypothetical protein